MASTLLVIRYAVGGEVPTPVPGIKAESVAQLLRKRATRFVGVVNVPPASTFPFCCAREKTPPPLSVGVKPASRLPSTFKRTSRGWLAPLKLIKLPPARY